MSGGKYWFFEEKQNLQKMTESGSTMRECAHLLNRSHSSIKHEIGRGGGIKDYSAKASQERLEKGRMAQKEKVQVPFTEQEKARITEMRAKGNSLTHMAAIMGCGRNRLKNHFEIANGERNTGLLDYTRTMKERMYCLETQMEIVLEELENLKRRK